MIKVHGMDGYHSVKPGVSGRGTARPVNQLLSR
jgi:hypothetical protein